MVSEQFQLVEKVSGGPQLEHGLSFLHAKINRLARLFLAIGFLQAAWNIHAQSNLVLFVSSPGDYIGLGQTYVTEDPNQFSMTGTPSSIAVSAFGFSFHFAGPGGSNLVVGTYANASRWPFNGTAPGLDVSGNGRGCNTECGSFQVNELVTNKSNQVVGLWLTYSNSCQCSEAPMTGEIRYNSELAPAVIFFLQQPTNQFVSVGGSAVINVNVLGLAPMYFNWFLNGTNIAVTTNGQLVIPNFQLANAGNYSLVVTNSSATGIGNNFTLAPLNVCAWGAGTNYGSSPNYGQCLVPTNANGAVAVAAGGYHNLALLPSGAVVGWGNNSYGQINYQSTLTNASAISAGLYHSLALRSNNTVLAWGYSGYGQTSVPASATNLTAIAAGWYHSLALQSNGTVVAWGAGASYYGFSPYFGQCLVPTNLAGVSAIAAGGYHSLALLNNGTVVAWGYNAAGQTNVPAGLNNVVAIAAGASNSLALKSDGTLVAWGDNSFGQTNIPAGLSNVVAIVCGAAHEMALKHDRTLIEWGMDGNGQTNFPPGLSNILTIAAGGYHSLATVNVGPVVFLNQPSSQTTYEGNNVTFTAATLGSLPIAYQWFFNGVSVATGTNSSLAIPGVQFTNAGIYQLVASNSFGSVSSLAAQLTVVSDAPNFTVQPTNSSVLQNATVTLVSQVGGPPPINCQWLFNGFLLPGATNATLTITNVQTANQGTYLVLATNGYGSNLSSNAFLYVIDVPAALGATNLTWWNRSSPAWFAENTNTHNGFAAAAVGPLVYGAKSLLQAAVTGPGNLSFWWAGQTPQIVELSFLIDGVQQVSQELSSGWVHYTYYLPAKNHILTWTAANALYAGNPAMGFLDQVAFVPGGTAVSIFSPPANQTNSAGSNVSFGVSTMGTPPISYQWYFEGMPITGATGSSLSLNNIQPSNAGSYSVVASNGYGAPVSAGASLSVTPSAPAFTTQPSGGSVLLGGQMTFSSAAVGSSPIYFQWLVNGQPIAGDTNTFLTITNVQYASAGNYSLVASNSLGSTNSTSATLTPYSTADLGATLDNPAIAWSTTNVSWFPETNTTYDGVSAAQSGVISGSQQSTLQGIITGPATVTYWWMVNCDSFWMRLGFILNGDVQNTITGSVGWVQATNYVGAGSQTLEWNLYPNYGAFAGGTGWVDEVQISRGGTPPSITSNPNNSTNHAGASVVLSSLATGTPPLSYQWQFNNIPILGETNASFTIMNLQTNSAGIYSVVVTNDFGSATSSNAALAVNASAPVITAQPSSQSQVVNGSATFLVTAQGSSPLAYQWQFNGATIVNANSNTLMLASLQATNAGAYTVIVTNAFGSVTSSVALLFVNSTVVLDYWPVFASGYSAPFGLSNVTAIAAGASHTLALRSDGTAAAWGNNTYGQTNLPAGLSNLIAIAAGANHNVALLANGTVVSWGDNTYGQLLVPVGLSNVTAIVAGGNESFAWTSNGSIVGWGLDANGQLDVPSGVSNVLAIAAGLYNGFGLHADGTVSQWGNGPVWQQNGVNTQLVVAAGISNVAAVAAAGYSAWTLQNDGSVSGWGWDSPIPVAGSGIAAVAAAGDGNPLDDYVLALAHNGAVFNGGISSFNTPYIFNYPSNVVAIAAGPGHAAVLVNDGAPQAVGQALSRVVYSGATVEFASSLVGAPPLTCQWLFNGSILNGATNAILVLTNVPLAASGCYQCIASNCFGLATNLSATLTVLRSTLWFNPGNLAWTNGGLAWELDQCSGHGAIVIYASTNLISWVPIFTNAPVTGSVQILDPSTNNQPARFYQAVEQ